MKPKTSGNTPAILPGATFDCYETEYYQKFQLCSLDGTSTPGSSDGLTQGCLEQFHINQLDRIYF